jgi:hypothetical protein
VAGPTGPTGPNALWPIAEWGSHNVNITAGSLFLQAGSMSLAANAAEGISYHLMSAPGVVRHMQFRITTALAIDTMTFTLRKNFVATAFVLAIPPGSTTGSLNGSLSYVAGDIFTVQFDQSGVENPGADDLRISISGTPT